MQQQNQVGPRTDDIKVGGEKVTNSNPVDNSAHAQSEHIKLLADAFRL